MTKRSDGTRVGRWFSGLSTAIKMLLILASALSPLGFVAVFASVDAAHEGRLGRELSARSHAARSAGAISALVSRDALVLRLIADLARSPRGSNELCALVDRARRGGRDLVLDRFALFDAAGVLSCGDPGISSGGEPSANASAETRISLAGDGTLRIMVAANDRRAVAVLDGETLRGLSASPAYAPGADLWLQQGSRRLPLNDGYERGTFQRTIVSRARLAGSDVFAVVALGAIPISATEIATILLPLLMWFAAALLGWLIVDRLLIRPIVGMQQAVLAYRPGGAPIAIPDTLTPANEIRDLGGAFTRVTRTIADHEADLEAAVARQARLVREVHHRVKNNLQVVASLLNLHARGAKSQDAANAYATIQRRVDALSVVHRNHHAELEDGRGVALRNLLSELTGNLRATAPISATGMAITLDLDTAFVNQDVAVSVAFFVTEVVEHAMLCTPDRPVGVTLRRIEPLVARLTLSSASLKSETVCKDVDTRQFERITTGLSRQLRAVLDRNAEDGVFGINIAVLPAAASL